ncbi:MAG: DUF2202 domain-containing protein [Arenibacter sp.]|nr:DUF2202 domain-containing protein [Arenibacter sp.]
MKDLIKTAITQVFKSLECGIRNHLRSFVNAMELSGNTYEPQYLPLEDYT